MLKTLFLCILVPREILETVLGEVEKESFIALPGRGGHSGLMLSEPRVPIWERPWEFL